MAVKNAPIWLLNSRAESHKYSIEREKSKRPVTILYGFIYVKCKIGQNEAVRSLCSDIRNGV